jgi:hypothetical protein
MTGKRSVHSDDGGEEVLDKTKASKRKGKEKEEIESQVVNEEREVTNWAEVPAVAELKTSETSSTKKLVSTDLLSKVLCMFSTQDNRRYALSFSIAGRSVAFSLLDRAGMITSTFNMNEEPDLFLHMLLGLSTCSDYTLGYDDTISPFTSLSPSHRIISAGPYSYNIESLLFISGTIHGRGTVCWLVSRSGKQYVIKDSWADVTRFYTEADILTDLVGIQGVPVREWSGIVESHGIKQTTASYWPERKTVEMDYPVGRVHHRLVLSSIGSPLARFGSKKHLIGCIISAINSELSFLTYNLNLLRVSQQLIRKWFRQMSYTVTSARTISCSM